MHEIQVRIWLDKAAHVMTAFPFTGDRGGSDYILQQSRAEAAKNMLRAFYDAFFRVVAHAPYAAPSIDINVVDHN